MTQGSTTPCEQCAIGKGLQKNLRKDIGESVALCLSPIWIVALSKTKTVEGKNEEDHGLASFSNERLRNLQKEN